MTFLFDTICDDIIEVIVDEKNKIVKKKNKKNHSILLNPVLWDIKMLFYGTNLSDPDDIPIDKYYEFFTENMVDENGYPFDWIEETFMTGKLCNQPIIKTKYESLKIDRRIDVDIDMSDLIKNHYIDMCGYQSQYKHRLNEEICEKIKCIN